MKIFEKLQRKAFPFFVSFLTMLNFILPTQTVLAANIQDLTGLEWDGEKIVEEARKHYGVKYAMNGVTPGAVPNPETGMIGRARTWSGAATYGLDCSGFVDLVVQTVYPNYGDILVAAPFGEPQSLSNPNVGTHWWHDLLNRVHPVSKLEDAITGAVPGDILIWYTADYHDVGTSYHMGIYSGDGKVIHCSPEFNGVAETNVSDISVKDGSVLKGYVTYNVTPAEPTTAKLTENASGKETVTVQFDINKKDSESQKPLEGVEFEFYRDNEKIGTSTTDANGKAVLNDTLVSDNFTVTSKEYTYVSDWNGMGTDAQRAWLDSHSGIYADRASASAAAKREAENAVNSQKEAFKNKNHSYKVVETKTRAKYYLDPSQTTQTQSKSGDTTISMEFLNTRIKADVEIEKTDAETGEFIAQNSEDLKTSLDGAVYELHAKEDILDPADGSVIYQKDELVNSVTITNNRGQLTDLYLGEYYWKEVQPAPGYHSGFFVDGELVDTIDVTLDTAETNVARISAKTDAKDQITTTKIRKVDSNGDPVKGATLVVLDKETNKKIKFNTGEEETDDKKEWISNGEDLEVRGLVVGKTYVLQEIHAPNGVMMSEDIEFTIDDATEIQEVTMVDESNNPEVPVLGTTATVDGKKEVSPSKKVTITDVVKYSKMDEYIGKEVLLEGQLMDKKTGEALAVEGAKTEKTFTPEKAEGTVEMTFIIDASALGGHDVVVYEELKNEDNKPIAEHKDINDEGQTVSFKEELTIKTLATVNGEHKFSPNGEVTLTDKVGYSGLTPGETYTVSGTLMDKETRKALIVDGSTVTAQTQFTAENSTGVVEVPFTFNSDSLQGKTIVVFEKLLDVNGNVIATHEDIKDKDQTVQVVGLSIRTSATINGQKEVAANGVMDLVDTVTYTGLSPKTEYTLKGTLMDKATGKALEIEGATSEAKFTPDAADGKTTLTFKIDTSKLVGKEIVVFEELYSKDNKKIAEHKDLKDKDQTVKILDISIRTKATIDGQKSVVAGGKKDIVDTVTYKGLTPNKEYTLKGVLMDKETNGALNVTGATSVAKFIPSQADGEATMKFTIDTSKLAGKSIVVFEELYDNNGNKVAEHKDINDADQTVSIQVKGTATTHAPNTGTTIQAGAFLALMIGFLGFAAYMNKKRKDASVK